MAFVSLELDTDQIYVASAKPAGRSIEVQHAFSIPLGSADDVAVGALLKSELNDRGLARTDVIVVVNRSSVEIRELDVPPAPDNELPDMVRLIARNEFASLNDQWLLDFVPLATDPNLPRKVLASGLSPERYRKILKIAESAGLKIRNIVLRPFASFDLLQSTLKNNGCRLIIDWCNDQADMIVSSGTGVVATRTIRLPAAAEQSQRYKSLLSEVKRTIASSRSTLNDREISEVIVLGESQDNQSFVELLREQLSIEIQSQSPFQLVERSAGFAIPQEPARYAALLGALAQQYSGTRHQLDYLNPRRPVVKKSDRSRTYLYSGVAAAVAMLALLFCWWTLRSQSNEIANLDIKLRAAVEKNKGGKDGASVEQTLGEVAKIDDWKKADINWLEELYQYSDRFVTPDDAIVDSFDAGLRRDEPQIAIRSRTAGGQKESAVVEALDSRPYEVIPTKRGDSSEDSSYPASFDFNVLLSADRSGVIKEIDANAAEFLMQRNALKKE